MSRFSAFLGLATIISFVGILIHQGPARRPLLELELAVPPRATPSTGAPPAVEFRESSLDWRVAVNHQQTSDQLTSLAETLGAGICALDANGDGWMDLFFVGGSGHTRRYGKKSWWHKARGNRLLLNRQGRYLEDVTEQAGLASPHWGMSCSVADLDNDGLPDLIVTGVGGSHLFKNQGDATFTDVTAESGFINDRWSTAASLADFDGDGLLDIYVSNYIRYRQGARTFERTSGFRSTLDVAFDQTLYDPEPNRLYRNLGEFRFEEVASELGVSNALGRSLGARWIDINDDRWPDLLVINDHDTPSQFFLNEEGQTFSRGGARYAALEIAGAHDVAIGDFDQDSHDEIFMSRGLGQPPVLLTYSDEKKKYLDTAWIRGLAQAPLLPFSGWASVSADFNNDGSLDLYVANGVVTPDLDSPFVSQAQANHLFLNDGTGAFALRPPSLDKQRPYSSRGAISVDLNNDGHLEIVVANNNDRFEIFENTGSEGRWLVLDLTAANREADVYGSRLTVVTDTLTTTRVLQAPQHFLSQGDPRIHIGLGRSSEVALLEIRWRDGSRSAFEHIAANQHVSIDKNSNTLSAKRYEVIAGLHFDAVGSGLATEAFGSLAHILLTRPLEAHNAEDFGELWRFAPADARGVLLRKLGDHWDSLFLSIARKALADTSAGVRVGAVQLFESAELEESVGWLIPLLEDEEFAVQCAVAEAFRFFFDEEEAVTHRKMLAISPLIRLLESASSEAEARICAANALAAAENKRAIAPLIRLSESHSNVAVKTAAIRALGRIRDVSARKLLRGYLADPSSDSTVVASSLIALSRLDDPTLRAMMDRVFDRRGAGSVGDDLVRRFDILRYLFATSDGIVFPRERLEGYLRGVIRQGAGPEGRLASRLARDGHTSAAAMLRAVAAGRVRSLYETVLSFVSSSDSEVRSEALVALASLDTQAARSHLEARLLRESPEFIERVTTRVSETTGYGFSAGFVSALLQLSDTSGIALDVLRRLPRRTASAMFGLLLGEAPSDERLLALLQVCSKVSLAPSPPDRSLWAHPSEKVRFHYALCYLQNDPASEMASVSTVHSSLQRIMLKAALDDPQWDRDAKAAVLIKAAENDAESARTLLATRIRSVPAKWLPAALDALAEVGVVAAVEKFLWALFASERFDLELRLQAAALLVDLDRERVLDRLHRLFDTAVTRQHD